LFQERPPPVSSALKPRPHRREPPHNLAVVALTSLASSTFAVLELVDVWVAAVEKKQCHAVVRPRAVGCSTLPLTLPGIPQSPNQPPTPPPPRTHSSSRIHPRRQLKEVSAKVPLSALTHVKRVQRRDGDDGSRLRVLLCECSDASPDGGAWPAPVRDLVDRFALAPERASVPGRAPRTRDQWEEWNALWPIAWQKPNSHLAVPLEAPSAEDVTEMKRWMRSCIDAAREGGATNAAILVDPSQPGTVIARGLDETRRWRCVGDNEGEGNGYLGNGHPLRHCALVAIDDAARRDAETYPAGEDEKNISSAPERTPHAEVGEKRRRGETLSASEMTETLGRPYLCTGYDAYLVREPCVMCAMALTHSRVRRVIFGASSPGNGALGGGKHSLHGQRTLNHHYQVYTFGLSGEEMDNLVRGHRQTQS
jgi:tRNA-specific adenosine deaminase 3